jgi:hypothetical protein
MQLFLLVAMVLSMQATNRDVQKPAHEKAQSTSIHELYLEDQADRGAAPGRKSASPEQMAANDAERRRRAHQLLDAGRLKSASDFHDAAFIFQHGDAPDDYLLAHALAMVAVSKGDPHGRWIAAATLDRYLQSIGRAQVFGTQYLTRSYVEYLSKAAAAQSAKKKDNDDENSGTKNPEEWVQEPYKSSLISDSLRAEYCVVPLEEQRKNVTAMNQGNEGKVATTIPGCSK